VLHHFNSSVQYCMDGKLIVSIELNQFEKEIYRADDWHITFDINAIFNII
jgi:hypothetical protein